MLRAFATEGSPTDKRAGCAAARFVTDTQMKMTARTAAKTPVL
jgi:hypothetical protein